MSAIGPPSTQNQSTFSKLYDIAEVVVQTAIRVAFVVLHLFMALGLPVAYQPLAIPCIAIGATTLAAFFFPSSKILERIEYRQKYPLLHPPQIVYDRTGFPEGAPVGYRNLSQNCAINSLAHFLDSDPFMSTWARYGVSSCTQEQFLIFLDFYDPLPQLRQEFIEFLKSKTEKKDFFQLFYEFLETVDPGKYGDNKHKVLQIKDTFEKIASIHPELREFYQANDEAVKSNIAVSKGSSQNLRLALHKIKDTISKSSAVQLDAEEALSALLEAAPESWKPLIRESYEYDMQNVPQMLEKFRPIDTRQPFIILSLPQDEKPVKLEALIKAFCENVSGVHEKQRRNTADGWEYEYSVSKQIFEFVEIPNALRFQINRKQNGEKLLHPISCPERISITLANKESRPYKLASFVTHLGEDNAGHYVAGQIIKGEKFIENDQIITHVKSQDDINRWNERLQEAYLLCYLPEEAQG